MRMYMYHIYKCMCVCVCLTIWYLFWYGLISVWTTKRGSSCQEGEGPAIRGGGGREESGGRNHLSFHLK